MVPAPTKMTKQYKRADLLILDEWLLLPLKVAEARDVPEIVEDRHQKGSAIFLSQFATAGWHTKIGESTLADAILDRIVHDSYEIFIDGKDSMRKHKGLKKQNTSRGGSCRRGLPRTLHSYVISSAGPPPRNRGPFFAAEWTVSRGRADHSRVIFTKIYSARK